MALSSAYLSEECLNMVGKVVYVALEIWDSSGLSRLPERTFQDLF
jgi:hypothetical protein